MEQNLSGYWNIKKVKLKKKFPSITEADLSFPEGKENIMLEILGYKLGKSKHELISLIVEI
jgi:hypothetical protein